MTNRNIVSLYHLTWVFLGLLALCILGMRISRINNYNYKCIPITTNNK
jgi:hypothetical protein